MYYVISLYHTSHKDKFLVLWMPENKGYCYSKSMAGIYKGEPIKDCHNSDSNMSISVELADELFRPIEQDGVQKMMIPKKKEILSKLGLYQHKNRLFKSPKP
jgi:hypothetical protein